MFLPNSFKCVVIIPKVLQNFLYVFQGNDPSVERQQGDQHLRINCSLFRSCWEWSLFRPPRLLHTFLSLFIRHHFVLLQFTSGTNFLSEGKAIVYIVKKKKGNDLYAFMKKKNISENYPPLPLKLFIHLLLIRNAWWLKFSREYHQLRARRAILLFKYVPLRTRRVLSPWSLHTYTAFLVLNGTSLNIDSALLALNRRYIVFLN